MLDDNVSFDTHFMNILYNMETKTSDPKCFSIEEEHQKINVI